MLDFDAIKGLKVLLVGDAIVDEYRFVTPIGKSVKDNIISTRYERSEEFSGGVYAAAQDVRNLCVNVDVLRGPKVMRNVRYVEESNWRKLFTIHHNEEVLPTDPHTWIYEYDLVIVTDFGHGTMTTELISQVSSEAKFLAVNAQTNSTNYGFNLILKYPRADYVVLDQLEARLAMHDRESPIETVLSGLPYQRIVATMGSGGAIGWDRERFFRQEARTNQVIDTMGAGDAFLAASAPFACIGASLNDIVSVGNAAGAAKVGILGHRRSITREDICAFL